MNMFDQFEQAVLKPKNNYVPLGYMVMKMEQDVPIFSKAKMSFAPSDKITHVAICNKQLVLAMANSVLFRMNLQQPDQQDGNLLNMSAM